MSMDAGPRTSTVLARWLLGTALVSWRYMWQTTPLYRSERECELLEDDLPQVPTALVDDAMLLPDDGVGPLFHRLFGVRIVAAARTAEELMDTVIRDFAHFVPSEVVGVVRPAASTGALAIGEEFVVKMPGPWDGPVRVVHVDRTCLRLVTLRGHLESGQVRFQARCERDAVVFEVEAWARPSTPLVHLLYSHLRLAKEIQLNMWVRFCRAAAATAGGRPQDGIYIRTERAGEQ